MSKEDSNRQGANEFLSLLRKVAEGGDIEAQMLLVFIFTNGFAAAEVEKNDIEAVKWLRRAAEQGFLDAQVALGNFHAEGRGVSKDFKQAVFFWQKAAKRGHAEAQFNLAVCFFSGNGVPQSLVESYKWANLASAQGKEDAQRFRDNLASKMGSAEIAQAQRRAIAEAANYSTAAELTDSNQQQLRQTILSEVRREVWRRDGGKCVKCGSRLNLEYDHIIPVTKGGSNTARNIELLCEACNRAKRDSIQ